MDGQSLQPRSHRRPEPRIPSRRPTKDHGSHVLDHLNVLYKYRHVAISVFLLVVLGVLLRTYTTVPLYRAQARLMIELEDERTAAIAGAINTVSNTYWQDPQVYYETQYRILTGRELGRRVVHRLDLAKVAEFNGAGPAPKGINRIVSAMKGAVASPFRHAAPETPPPPADGEAAESAMVGALLSRVGVDPVQNSRLVDVTFVSAEPAFAARAINALADEYVQQNLELRRQNMVTSLEWLSQELVKQQQKVEDSERAMAQYREDQNALSLEDRQNIVVSRLNQLNDAVTKAKTNRVQKQSLYDQVRNLSPDAAPDTIPAILQNPYIQTIKTRLAELQREKATMLERYGEKYPDVMKVNASLEDVKVQLQTELKKAIAAIQNDYESARAEERTLAGSLEEQKNAAMDLNRKSVSYTVLERDANSNRQVYETLLQREKELQVMANSRGNNVRITDRAEQPVAPFTPAPRRDLMLALMAGVSLALGLVFVLDYLNDTVKTPDDVTEKLKIPLLGLAPKVRGDQGVLLSQDVPHEFGEAFRSLRTSLIFSTGSEKTRLVMVTSAQPLEGKTTTSCNLALALAIGGARVLLIDADMRRPGVHRTLDLENSVGLSQVLTGQATLASAIRTVDTPKLTVLTAGTPPPNPSELLGSERMSALLRESQAGGYDWVLVDTPPVLAVTDAVVLAPLVDGVAFVIGSEMTRRQHASRALETLMISRAHLFGGVLNQVDLQRNKYYYSRYYGYKSRGYYSTPAA